MADNTLTSLAMVNSQTSSDFRTENVQAVLATAFVYCNSKDAGNDIDKTGSDWSDYVITDEGEAMAVSMLASAILLEGRRALKSRDENIIIRTIDRLFTEEMRNLLLTADETDEDTVSEDVMWSNENPTEGWEVY